MKNLVLLGNLFFLVGCASGREFWTHTVEEPVYKPSNRERGTLPSPGVASGQHVRVAFNDGSTSTEVDIPVLTSGQMIVVDQKARPAGKSLGLVPLPPTSADKALVDAYVKSGQPVNTQAPQISIVKTHATVQQLVKQGNYSLALEYVAQVLERYPNHPETLRIKGSLLLKIGEKEAALETYRKAQGIEPNARVQKQIEELEKTKGKGF